MFIQIIQGKCTRQDECREMGERWRRELAPGADGWLGGTYGFTDDGDFMAIVRFDSRESAARNSARPEQGAWWRQMEALFDGPVAFHDSADVTLMLEGGSDDAGFVQVIRGKVDDPATLKAMMTDTEQLHEMRPEILGGTLAIEEDGTFTETIAFTDEESARRGEQTQMPDDVRRAMASSMHDVTYADLHHPWFASKA
jgi:hypothetical protein